MLVAVTAWGGSVALAQGSFDTIRTGGVFPATVVRSGIRVSEQLPQITFQFGFATDEEIVPELFLDSVTGSLQAADSLAAVVVLFTADRSGVNWAPESPGAIPLARSAIQPREIAFPTLEQRFAHESAFEVVVDVPASLRDRGLDFHFELFDNENAVQSLAWLSGVTVVPEPSVLALSAVSFWLFKRRNN